jgi:hypothetical protein
MKPSTTPSISTIAGRVVAVLLGAAVLVVLALLVEEAKHFSWVLIIYGLILLAPLLVLLGWRLVGLWRLGFQKLPTRPARRVYIWTVAVFFTLTVLLYSFESWRGRRAYAALKREVEAQGASLSLAAVIPPAVPDSENFCSTPLLRIMVDHEYAVSSPRFRREHLRWRDPEAIQRLREIQIPYHQKEMSRTWLRGEYTDLAAWAGWFATNSSNRGSVVNLPTNRPAEAVLRLLSPFDSELNELRVASQRPKARWALRYEDGFFLQLGIEERDEFLRNFIHLLVLRSVASLELGQGADALADWKLGLRLAQSTKDEPSFFVHLWRLRLLVDLIQPLWEGLAKQRWTEQQLIEIQHLLNQIDLEADWARAVRGEIYLHMDLVRQVPELFSLNTLWRERRGLWSDDGAGLLFGLGWLAYPRGWAYEDQVTIYRLYEAWAAGQTLCCTAQRNHVRPDHSPQKPIDPLLIIYVFPRLRQILVDVAPFCFTQFALDATRVACALERCRLTEGEFPADLTALTPRFLDKPPRAPGTQDPFLVYERTADGQFLLRPAFELEAPYWWHVRLKDVKALWRYSAEPRGNASPAPSHVH